MLPVQECRQYLENDEQYSDEEIRQLSDCLHELAEIALDIQEYNCVYLPADND